MTSLGYGFEGLLNVGPPLSFWSPSFLSLDSPSSPSIDTLLPCRGSFPRKKLVFFSGSGIVCGSAQFRRRRVPSSASSSSPSDICLWQCAPSLLPREPSLSLVKREKGRFSGFDGELSSAAAARGKGCASPAERGARRCVTHILFLPRLPVFPPPSISPFPGFLSPPPSPHAV